MKSEERHRLQESELEKWGRHARSFWESFAENYLKTALIAVLIVCAIAVGLAWYFISSANSQAERWNEVISASFDQDPSQSLVQLSNAATNYPDYPAGQWAALLQAEGALSEGIHLSRTNRPAAVEELLRARDAFTNLANADSEVLQERRAFGFARTLEALAGVDVSKDDKGKNVQGVEDAFNEYEKFVEQYPESIFVPMAENRIQALKNPQTKDFYAWYREQYPRPEDQRRPDEGKPPGQGGGGLPPGHPPFSPGQSPFTPGQAPPFPSNLNPGGQATEESLIQELENLNSGDATLGGSSETEQPVSAEKPMSKEGPALVSPSAPSSETKPKNESTPPGSDEKKPEKPASSTPKTDSNPK